MGLFDKKTCDICGKKIGLLGNRKLDDGNLCKDCAAKLSPWFSERRHSTVAQIAEQLKYREENLAAVRAFHATRTIGDYTKLLIDDGSRKFCVASGSDPLASNPDILDFSQAQSCELEINERRTEKKQTVNGKQVSYSPPRFEYSYDFHATIRVSGNPYFDEMTFSISNGPVGTGERNMNTVGSGWTVTQGVFGNPGLNKYNECVRTGNLLRQAVEGMKNAPAAPAPADDEARLLEMIERRRAMAAMTPEELAKKMEDAQREAEEALAGLTPEQRRQAAEDAEKTMREFQKEYEETMEAAQKTAAASAPRFCPNCGAPNGGSKFCPNCGSRLS